MIDALMSLALRFLWELEEVEPAARLSVENSTSNPSKRRGGVRW